MKKLAEKYLTTILSSLLLFLIPLCEAENYLSLRPHYILLFCIISLLFTGFCAMKPRNKGILFGSLFICIMVVLLYKWQTLLTFVQGFVTWLQGTAPETEPLLGWYPLFLVCLCSTLCFFFQLLAERLLILRSLTATALGIWLIGDVFTQRSLQHPTAVCAFGYIIITYIVLTQKHWKKHKNQPQRPYLIWILPFLVCYLLLMVLMPAPEKPYDWKLVKDMYQKLLVFAGNLPFGGREDFQPSISGFSEDGRLLGDFIEDTQEIMLLQPKNSLQTNVYLTGKVYDTFTGTQWLQTNTYKERDRKLDTLETLYAISLYDREQELNYIRSATLGITYLELHTGYLFAPLKTWKVIGNDLQYTDEDGNLLFDKMRGYGTTYDSYYFQLNVDHPLFYAFLEAPRSSDREVWKQILHKYSLAFEERLSLTDLETHQKTIQTLYGASYTLSRETEEWLMGITQNATTDIEKLKAIEAALSSLEYTRTPGALPESIASPEDFLDYFLLENKKGYCSYFATAFVLLARAEGIPARYVEGFCVPIKGTEPTTVYGNQAHAWPEVYIQGVGWIPFEPTPGYAEIRYTPWEERDYTATAQPDDALEEEEESSDTLPDASPENTALEEATQRQLLPLLSLIALLLAAVLVLLFIADRWLTWHRYSKLEPQKQFLTQVQLNLQLLTLLGYPRAQTETLAELQERVQEVLTAEQDGHEIHLQFLTLYEELLYQKRPVSEAMLLQVQKERTYLLNTLKHRKYWAYLYYKITRIGGRL